MANFIKSKEEILAEIEVERLKHFALSEINNNSAAGVYRQLVGMVATVVYNLRSMLQRASDDMDINIAQKRFGSKDWYREKVLAFQLGFNLTVVGGETGYAEINDAAKIVKTCQVRELYNATFGGYILLVEITPNQSLTGSESFTPVQLSIIQEYVNQVKIVGTKVVVSQQIPDWLRLNIEVRYNRLVVDNTGRSILTGAYPIKIALEDYINNTFHEELSRQDIFDFALTIPEIAGTVTIRDFRKFIDNSLATIEPNSNNSVSSLTGTFKISPDSVITYV